MARWRSRRLPYSFQSINYTSHYFILLWCIIIFFLSFRLSKSTFKAYKLWRITEEMKAWWRKKMRKIIFLPFQYSCHILIFNDQHFQTLTTQLTKHIMLRKEKNGRIWVIQAIRRSWRQVCRLRNREYVFVSLYIFPNYWTWSWS